MTTSIISKDWRHSISIDTERILEDEVMKLWNPANVWTHTGAGDRVFTWPDQKSVPDFFRSVAIDGVVSIEAKNFSEGWANQLKQDKPVSAFALVQILPDEWSFCIDICLNPRLTGVANPDIKTETDSKTANGGEVRGKKLTAGFWYHLSGSLDLYPSIAQRYVGCSLNKFVPQYSYDPAVLDGMSNTELISATLKLAEVTKSLSDIVNAHWSYLAFYMAEAMKRKAWRDAGYESSGDFMQEMKRRTGYGKSAMYGMVDSLDTLHRLGLNPSDVPITTARILTEAENKNLLPATLPETLVRALPTVAVNTLREQLGIPIQRQITVDITAEQWEQINRRIPNVPVFVTEWLLSQIS